MKLCAAHAMPYCRICNKVEKPAFGTVKTPLANKKRDQARMSPEATIQEGLGPNCILLGFMAGDCGEKRHRCHIVSQELIRETYKHGAIRLAGEEFWRPAHREGVAFTLAAVFGIAEPVEYEVIHTQQILDMSANLVPGCDAHNKDGIELVDALDARKVAGLPSYPAGFGEFTHAFRFSIEGSTYWYYVPFEQAAA